MLGVRDPPASSDAPLDTGFWAYDAFPRHSPPGASSRHSAAGRNARRASPPGSRACRSPPAPLARGAGGSMTIRGVGLSALADGRWNDTDGSADEIAAVFLEAAPHMVGGEDDRDLASSGPPRPDATRAANPSLRPPNVLVPGDAEASALPSPSPSPSPSPGPARLRERLDRCVPFDVAADKNAADASRRWSRLRFVARSEDVSASCAEPGGVLDVNSGGAVFFCVFAPDPADSDPADRLERVSVLKFCANRLAAQSEYFAGEIAAAVGVAVPPARVLRRGGRGKGGRDASDDAKDTRVDEWALVRRRVRALAEESGALEGVACASAHLLACLDKHHAALAMTFVRGAPLFEDVSKTSRAPLRDAFADPRVAASVADALGRVFVLDALLGNPDRLPCARMRWRGNPGNLLFDRRAAFSADAGAGADDGAGAGAGAYASGTNTSFPFAGVVAIDQAVPRRPPAIRARADAANTAPAIECARNHPATARAILLEALGGDEGLERAGIDPEAVGEGGALTEAFMRGVRTGVDNAAKLKGLLDSLARGLYETLRMLFEDMEDFRAEAEAERKRAKTPADAEGKKTTQKDPASQSTQQKEKSSPARALLEVRRSERSPPDRGEGPGAVGGKMLLPQKALEFPGDGGGAMVPTTPGSREPSDLDPDTPPRCEGGRSTPPRERGVADRPSNTHAQPADTDARGGIGTPAGIAVAASAAPPPPAPLATQGTMRLRAVHRDAKAHEGVGEWLADWEDVMRDDKAQLRARCGEWASRRGFRAEFSTGFLDVVEGVDGRDIVDCYELWVRLSHLAHRGAGVVAAQHTRAPSLVAPGLYLGGALAANARHTLRALGVVDVLNCTDDLEDAHADAPELTFRRLPAKDVPGENLARHFDDASEFLGARGSDAFGASKGAEAAARAEERVEGSSEGSAERSSSSEGSSSGAAPRGAALVHCFEGKSRSATIVAQHLVRVRREPLRTVLAGMKKAHPDAKPNDGFVRLLAAFEEAQLGSRSVDVEKRRGVSSKPQIRSCPKCGAKCGISAQSVTVHIKKMHPGMGK